MLFRSGPASVREPPWLGHNQARQRVGLGVVPQRLSSLDGQDRAPGKMRAPLPYGSWAQRKEPRFWPPALGAADVHSIGALVTVGGMASSSSSVGSLAARAAQ